MDRRWLLGGVLLAGGFGFIRAVTYRPKLEKDSRLLLIGDSLAQGLMPQFQVFATEAGIGYVGTGIPGSFVHQWASSDWLVKKLIEFKPTHVLVSLGANDAYSGLAPAAVEASAVALVEKLKAADAHVIWIGAPALPETLGTSKVDEATLSNIRSAAPYYFASEEYSIPRGPDNLHPSVQGYAGWAGAIWNWLT